MNRAYITSIEDGDWKKKKKQAMDKEIYHGWKERSWKRSCQMPTQD